MFSIRCTELLAIAAALWWPYAAIADSRGSRRLSADVPNEVQTFDPKQSAALFVGVRRFPHDRTLTEVPFAVDDAIDLAFALALESGAPLVDPSRVILALSGEPQKTESRQNLARLVAAGAQVQSAGQADILTALDTQMRAAGRKGILVLAFATHGVSQEGTQYLLTASSLLRHRETGLSESKVRDIASRSAAARSLILVDACRERLSDDGRNTGTDVRSAAPLLQAMANAHGQVVLSAEAAGQYAYDDFDRRNGVFTAAVIDGLRCEAATDERGFVTVETLTAFVEQRVLAWIHRHREMHATRATQLTSEGGTKNLPLAVCRNGRRVPAMSQPVVPLQPPRSQKQILLLDTFDDNRHHWYVSTDPLAPAAIENGVYVLSSKPFGGCITSRGPLIDENADFQMAVTARRLHGAHGSQFGLLWGLADNANFYFFLINDQGGVQIGVIDDGANSVFKDSDVFASKVRKESGVYRLKITKSGKSMRFFANETLVHDMASPPFFDSGVGLVVLNKIAVAFDDLVVEGSPAK